VVTTAILKDDVPAILAHHGIEPEVVFDVGANLGQTLEWMRWAWPHAEIHAFEPAPATFELLRQAGHDATLHQVALGHVDEETTCRNVPGFQANRVGAGGVTVTMRTGDLVMQELGLGRIDFLKVDAEGYDLKVLAGFYKALRDGRIGSLMVEATLLPRFQHLVRLDKFVDYLDGRYVCARIVDQRLNIQKACNAIFVPVR
jgi:FkbM family methyltransferase